MHRASLITLVCAILAVTASLAWARSDPVFDARRAAEELRAATRALSDAKAARDRVRALSNVVKAYEDGLRAMRQALRQAAIKERALKLEFRNRREQLSRLLGILQTLEKASTPLLLLHPSGPLGTAEAGQILTEVTPALNRKVADLRARLSELQALQKLQKTALADLKEGLKGVQDARVALAEAIGRRTRKLPPRFASDPEKIRKLARNSDTLTKFASGLSDIPVEGVPETPQDFSAAKGKLPLPVYGTILRRFNEADASGVRHPGIVISAPPVSLVTAPFSATIRYVGPLLDYGNVIILEPQPGYLIVLAGLGRVYGKVGQVVSAGDPVGLMRGESPSAQDFLVETSNANSDIRQETLYIEIRKNRTPVDPAAWFEIENR
ncbi:MAG: peptidoglycan DD-metalloendopeptidase family protein [Paracoccaceae bacterium]|nr:peptidoglycan DD-metalloendopeptidase family protein [Paracoccaceae bacterium]